MRDYRNKLVVAATVCLPQLGLGLIYKSDDDVIVQRSLQQTKDYIDAQNNDDDSSLELMVGRAYSTSSVQFLSDLPEISKNCSAAVNSTQCVYGGDAAAAMLKAVRGETGIEQDTDYNGDATYSAHSFSPELNAGLVLTIHRSEVMRPLIVNLLIVFFTAVGIIALGIAILVLSSRHMLNSLEESWEKGKQAVEQQRQSFHRLVVAM
eukprot:RCo001425